MTPAPDAADVSDIVRQAWMDVLGLATSDDDDDFYDAGGNSVLAIKLGDLVESDLNIEFPIETLFQYGTLGAVVAACERLRRDAG